MKKIAFFVEGQTEQIFINYLVKLILGKKQTNITQKQFRGGVNIPKQEIVRNVCLSRKPKYEVLISDCGSDNRVKSEMLDNIVNLRKLGYSQIVGLRDLYPIPFADLDKLRMGLNFLPERYKKEAAYFDIIIAVHEIEAWFLAEVNHLKRIDKRLNGPFIKRQLGFDPYTSNAEQREHPAKDMQDMYKLVGRSYTKRYWQVLRLVEKLDWNHIFTNLRYEIAPLGELITKIEDFRDE